MRVIKRDGHEVGFNRNKVIKAISKAGYVPASVKDQIATSIEKAGGDSSVPVEDIQDQVECMLMGTHYKDVAQRYVRYRYRREMLRNKEKVNDSILDIVDHTNQEVDDENSNKNPRILSTQRDYIAGEVSKDLSRRVLLDDDIIKAHDSGLIHFHDMDYYIQNMHNCDLVNLEDMLQDYTVISGAMIERPHSFYTACNVATQIMAQVASNQYGGQSESLAHLSPFVDVSRHRIRAEVEDEVSEGVTSGQLTLDPASTEYEEYVTNITERRVREEVKQGVQAIHYQITTLMTTNGQTPFVTIWMYLGEVPEGRQRDDLAMVIEEVIRQRYRGVKNDQGIWVTPAFPKLVYCLEEDNAVPGSRYWYLTELSAKCSAKRLVPDYVSEKVLFKNKFPKERRLTTAQRRDQWGDEHVWGPNPFRSLTDDECAEIDRCDQDGRHLTPKVMTILENHNILYNQAFTLAFPPMGCRSFLTDDPIHHQYYGRFNQGVVTINLVYVALEAVSRVAGSIDDYTVDDQQDAMTEFWSYFDDTLDLCHRALQARHARLVGTPSDVSPIHWQYGALARLQKGETIDPLLYGNYSTISLGYAGLYECVKAITGFSHTDDRAKGFALCIMQHMNDKCAEWRHVENISYSLYGTPLESTTYQFAQGLQRRFGRIPGITDHGYITNSYHVNVREHIDPFTKLGLEAEFQRLSPGGAISYVETVNLNNNVQAVLEVIRYIYEHIMYAELNTKSDYCQVCGYDGEIQIVEDDQGHLSWECPHCGNRDQSKMNVARRTCGYIGSQFWNQGRTEEIRDRYVHLGGE